MKSKFVSAVVIVTCIFAISFEIAEWKAKDDFVSTANSAAVGSTDYQLSDQDLNRLADKIIARMQTLETEDKQSDEQSSLRIGEADSIVDIQPEEISEPDIDERAKNDEFKEDVKALISSLMKENEGGDNNYYIYESHYEIVSPVASIDVDNGQVVDQQEKNQTLDDSGEFDSEQPGGDIDPKENPQEERQSLVPSDEETYISGSQICFTAVDDKEYVFAVEMYAEQVILVFPEEVDINTISVQLFANTEKTGEVIMDPDGNTYVSSEAVDGTYYVAISGLLAGEYAIGVGW